MRVKFDISKPILTTVYNILEKVVYEVSVLEYDIADKKQYLLLLKINIVLKLVMAILHMNYLKKLVMIY